MKPLSVIVFLLTASLCSAEERQRTRSVFLENHTKRPVVYALTINDQEPESVTIEPNTKLYLYEPVPRTISLEDIAPIEARFERWDGRETRSSRAVSAALQTVINTQGKIMITGWNSSHPYSVPSEEWLREIRGIARKIDEFKSIHALLLNPEKTEPSDADERGPAVTPAADAPVPPSAPRR